MGRKGPVPIRPLPLARKWSGFGLANPSPQWLRIGVLTHSGGVVGAPVWTKGSEDLIPLGYVVSGV